MTDLTKEMLAEFRRPFTSAAIKFKVQTTKKDNSAALASFYIDARLAAERLNTVVGIEGWTDDYRCIFESQPSAHGAAHFPVECRLTVLGVTKTDVGVYQKSSADSLAMKSAYSDAFKRAAVKFGVGALLYACPKVWAPVDVNSQTGKVSGFSRAGELQLRTAYEQFILSPAGKAAFGAPLDHGDVGSDDVEGDAGDATPSGGPVVTLNDAISQQIRAFTPPQKEAFREKFDKVTGEAVTMVGQAVTALIAEGYTGEKPVLDFLDAKLAERVNGNG